MQINVHRSVQTICKRTSKRAHYLSYLGVRHLLHRYFYYIRKTVIRLGQYISVQMTITR